MVVVQEFSNLSNLSHFSIIFECCWRAIAGFVGMSYFQIARAVAIVQEMLSLSNLLDSSMIFESCGRAIAGFVGMSDFCKNSCSGNSSGMVEFVEYVGFLEYF